MAPTHESVFFSFHFLDLSHKLEESMKTESALVEQLEKEANNAKQAKDEVDTLKAKLKVSLILEKNEYPF